MKLLLASKSEARRRMLAAAGVAFEIIDAPLDEERAKRDLPLSPPRELAERLAELKAKSASAPVGALVLGSDQTLETEDGGRLDKPGSRDEAAAQLRALSGRTHFLHSAAVIVENGEAAWTAVESVKLTVRPLSESFIQTYLEREYEAIRWSVGGYRLEGLGVQLFERIHGSHFAVLGLPLLPLLAELRARGLVPR